MEAPIPETVGVAYPRMRPDLRGATTPGFPRWCFPETSGADHECAAPSPGAPRPRVGILGDRTPAPHATTGCRPLATLCPKPVPGCPACYILGMEIEVVRGDITEQHVDAIVNAANSSLLGGGGVDGAIHRAGGPQILEECRELRRTRYPDGLPAGRAVATSAGRLPARWVIHTVGPVYSPTTNRRETLVSAYRQSLRVAVELGATTVAFPAVSAGVYGWPMADAADVAISTTQSFAAEPRDSPNDLEGHQTFGVQRVRFVLFSEQAFAAFEKRLSREDPGPR